MSLKTRGLAEPTWAKVWDPILEGFSAQWKNSQMVHDMGPQKAPCLTCLGNLGGLPGRSSMIGLCLWASKETWQAALSEASPVHTPQPQQGSHPLSLWATQEVGAQIRARSTGRGMAQDGTNVPTAEMSLEKAACRKRVMTQKQPL